MPENNYAEINLLNVANTTTKEDGTVEPKNAVLTTQVEKTNILDNYKFTKYPYTLDESVERAYKNRHQKRSELKLAPLLDI